METLKACLTDSLDGRVKAVFDGTESGIKDGKIDSDGINDVKLDLDLA
jgi:hypothetical protein